MNLTNKRILITRPRAQAESFADALIAEGAQPIFFPVIAIVQPDVFSVFDIVLQNLNQYNWIIFTSIHSVDAFFKRLKTLNIKEIPSYIQVAATGSKTARSLFEQGVSVDYVPEDYIAEGLLLGLGENISGKRFLLPQSNLANHVLATKIHSAGGMVDEVTAYLNIKNVPDESEIRSLITGVDIITFTSPSTVKNFIEIAQENGLDPLHLQDNPLIACIGPVTKKVAEEVGFTNTIMSKEYTTVGLIETLGNLVHL